ncbi:MAG: response regulator transcription factor [Gammaproteobacteria bacterium]|nr:response regulator transcription factor [Gammaproteobacteria bacterium]
MDTPEPKILIVEDDRRLSRLISRYLERAHFISQTVHNGDELHQHLKTDNYSLILLDIMLPGKSGLELAKEIRQISDIPIIFLTARADISDKVNGLDIGADDYITKPFEEQELIARIHSVLRRFRKNKPAAFTVHKHKICFAGWMLNTIDQTLTSPDGRPTYITGNEYQVLEALVRRPHKVLTRDDILALMSGREWCPLDRSADMAISKIRKKIEKDPKNPELIKTIRNKGYQLTADIYFYKSPAKS